MAAALVRLAALSCVLVTLAAPVLGSADAKPGTTEFDIYIGVSCMLVLIAGTVSGLTMGLMSLDVLNLTILQKSGTAVERVHASRIRPLVERHHLLLVTLLLCNAAAAEALPIFLDRLVHPVAAVLISVTAVLIFGEIVPQSVCTRYGLAIGSYLSPFVWLLIIVLFPVAWPISKLLDFLVGEDHGTYYRKAELKELVNIHTTVRHQQSRTHSTSAGGVGAVVPEHVDKMDGPAGTLTQDEASIVKGALDLRDKTAAMILTPIENAFMLEEGSRLDEATMKLIIEDGHSRVPIYRRKRSHIIGMILVKRLILLRPEDATPLQNVELFRIPSVSSDYSLYRLLGLFLSSRSHMAIVLDPVDMLTVIGIVTLEDVVEELIQGEIEDETEVFINGQRRARVVEAFKSGQIGPAALDDDESSAGFYRTNSNVQARPKSGFGTGPRSTAGEVVHSTRTLNSSVQSHASSAANERQALLPRG